VKTLTPALEAAQKAQSALPYVEALLADYDGYARRGRFTRHYSGAEQAGPAAAALAPDGSLVRLRRETDVTTVEYQVGASADDAFEMSGTVTLTDTSANIDATSEYFGARFTGVAIPQGATILRARLLLVLPTGNDDPLHTIYGDDADNAAQFTTGANDISGRAATAAVVTWDSTDLGGDGASFIASPDIKAVVQEIVDRGGWASGNAMAIIVRGGATSTRDLQPTAYDAGAALAPKLVVTFSAGIPGRVYVSQVASPAPGSAFSSWSSLDAGASYQGGVAMAVTATTLYAFVVDDDLVTLKVYTSANNGASWSGPATVSGAGGEKTHVAAAAAEDGDIAVFWAEADGVVYRSRWNGSSWGTRTAWTLSAYAITGLAAAYLLDWQVIVTGLEAATRAPKVWATRYGDGVNLTIDTWSALREVTGAAEASGVSFAAPAVAWEDDAFRLFFVETYDGDEAYTRLQWSTLALLFDFNEEQWREPAAFDFEGAHGVAVAISATRIWLVSSDGVWSSALPAFAELDVTALVLEASVASDARGTRVELELDPSAWDEDLVQRGARLQLTPGYRTSENETPLAYGYWVEAAQLVAGARPHVLVTARDGWWLLERWRARRQLVWAAGEKTVGQLLFFLTGRAGVEWTTNGSTSAALTTLQPAFTVHAGETGLTAVRRLLAMVEDVAWWDGPLLYTGLSADDDAATYELGAAGGHAVVEARRGGLALEVNLVRVAGLEVYGEAADRGDAEAQGERIATVIDVNLATGEECAARAAAVLRKARLAAELAEVRLFGVHCGMELWDVVELTQAQLGLEAEPLRVNAYQWRYEPRRGRYDMQLTLGPV
jgi:hypothetical protein